MLSNATVQLLHTLQRRLHQCRNGRSPARLRFSTRICPYCSRSKLSSCGSYDKEKTKRWGIAPRRVKGSVSVTSSWREDVPGLVLVEVERRRWALIFFSIAENLCKTFAVGNASNIFDLRFKVRRGREQGVVASLIRREGPRRCYGRGGWLSARQRNSLGDWSHLKTREQRQRPTNGSALTVMMSSPVLGWKKSKHRSLTVSFMATGGCATRLPISLREEAWGSLTVRPRPLARSSWRCSLPSYSGFSYQSAFKLRECTDGPSFLLSSSPATLFGVVGQKLPIWTCLKSPATHVSHLHKLTVRVAELRGSADRLFKVLLLPLMQLSKLHLICEATHHLAYALMYVHSVQIIWIHQPKSCPAVFTWHYRVLDCPEHVVRCSSVNVQCGDYRLVRRGYIGSSMVPGPWEWGWNFFVSLNSFVLFSLARIG